MIDKHRFDFDNLLLIDIQGVIGSPEPVPHGQNINLRRTSAHGGHRKIDNIRTGLDSRKVTGNAHTCRVVGMKLDNRILRKHFPCPLDSLENNRRRGCTRRILERHAVKWNLGIDNLPEFIDIELRCMTVVLIQARRKPHQGNNNLVLYTGIVNALTRIGNIADIHQRIEVADSCNPVLLEHFGVQINDIPRL